MTPDELAGLVGRSPKTVRQWLRDNYSQGHIPYDRWILSPEIVRAAISHWS
jgi:hypothetical protein